MVDSYEFKLTGGLMDGDTLARSLPDVVANQKGYDFEEYWHRFEVAPSGSQVITADVLDDARVIVVLGGPGVTVTFGSTGTEEIPANPFLFVSNEESGTGYDQVTINNNGSAEQKVTVIACSYKT